MVTLWLMQSCHHMLYHNTSTIYVTWKLTAKCCMCSGYGSWITTKHFCTVYIIYWGASPERRHLSLLIPHTYTFHQALEEIVSQRIALKPRLFIHSYNYIIQTSQSGLLRTSDGYSGLLRMATPDYSGWLRRPQGWSVPSPRASLALRKPPTRRPVSPVPVPSTSTIAGLGRDSRIYHGGGSSLCWSVACALRPHNPN